MMLQHRILTIVILMLTGICRLSAQDSTRKEINYFNSIREKKNMLLAETGNTPRVCTLSFKSPVYARWARILRAEQNSLSKGDQHLFELQLKGGQLSYIRKLTKAEVETNGKLQPPLNYGNALTAVDEQADELYKKGRSLYDKKEYEEAGSMLLKAIEKNAYNPEYAHLLANCYSKQKNYKQAITAAKSALEMDNGNALLYGIVACSYFELKDYSNASIYFEEALKCDKSNSSLQFFNYLNCLKVISDPKRAIEVFNVYCNRIEEGKIDKAADTLVLECYFIAAWAYQQTRQFDMALDIYSTLHEWEPGYYKINLERARLHRAIGNCKESVADYNAALRALGPEKSRPLLAEVADARKACVPKAITSAASGKTQP